MRIRVPLEVVIVVVVFLALIAFSRPIQLGGCSAAPGAAPVVACIP